MNLYLYSFLIAGTAGILWFWSQHGWREIFEENHPFQARIGVFVITGGLSAATVWLLTILGVDFTKAIGNLR